MKLLKKSRSLKFSKSLILFFLVYVLTCACSGKKDLGPNMLKSYQALDHLSFLDKGITYQIRILRVTDPRLPDLTDAQYKEIYEVLPALVSEYLEYNIEVVDAGKTDINDFFKRHEAVFEIPEMKGLIETNQLDIDQKTDLKSLHQNIRVTVMGSEPDMLNKYLPAGMNAVEKTPGQWGEYFYEKFLSDYRHITGIEVSEGVTLINSADPRTNNYWYWDTILWNLEEADFIISNTLIVTAEIGMPLHLISRGGITTGFVENNVNNSLSAAGLLTFQAFINQNPYFQREREMEIPPLELPEVIAYFMTHELGQILNRYRKYFDQEGCIYQTESMLHFYQWYQKVKSNEKGNCIPPSEKLPNF